MQRRRRRKHLGRRPPAGHRDPASLPPPGARLSPGRQLPRLHGRDRGRARAGALLQAHAGGRHEGAHARPSAPTTARKMVMELLVADQPARATSHDPTSSFWNWAERDRRHRKPLPGRRALGARPQPSRDARQPRRLHPVQSVRPRLPRGAGQRRDRHGLPQRRRQAGVRLRRPDGRVHLRRLRRVRAGLPDRRADAGRLPRTTTSSARSGRTRRWTACAPIAASAAR